MKRITRREFLSGAGSLAGAAALVWIAGCVPKRESDQVTRVEVPVTPASEFFEQAYSRVPEVNLEQYRLVVDGLVGQTLSLALADIKALPSNVYMRTVECIGNPAGGPLIGNARWTGFLIGELLSRARVQARAAYARFEALDGYVTSVDLAWLVQPDTILVYAMNGEPLPAEHGWPLRILMPGLYGQKMPKWITRVELVDGPVAGIWEKQGWSYDAVVKTNSQIQLPDTFPAGQQVIHGVAFAGKRPIRRVEVQVDEGPWLAAQLVQPPPYAWTPWMLNWLASPGDHRISARATDDTGFAQSAQPASAVGEAFPAGSDAIHTVTVHVE